MASLFISCSMTVSTRGFMIFSSTILISPVIGSTMVLVDSTLILLILLLMRVLVLMSSRVIFPSIKSLMIFSKYNS